MLFIINHSATGVSGNNLVMSCCQQNLRKDTAVSVTLPLCFKADTMRNAIKDFWQKLERSQSIFVREITLTMATSVC